MFVVDRSGTSVTRFGASCHPRSIAPQLEALLAEETPAAETPATAKAPATAPPPMAETPATAEALGAVDAS